MFIRNSVENAVLHNIAIAINSFIIDLAETQRKQTGTANSHEGREEGSNRPLYSLISRVHRSPSSTC